MTWGLPTAVEINGVQHKIRSDYRAVLDILTALTDPELTDPDKIAVIIGIFYEDPVSFDDINEALDKCFEFISRGEKGDGKKSPKLMDWEQDYQYIVAAINKSAGTEIRSLPYLHWWTFLGYYYDIGDCLFAQIVNIRAKRKKGQKLDKTEQEFYRNNRNLIEFKNKFTKEEDEFINKLIGGK